MTVAPLLPAAATVPPAVVAAAWMAWYYRRLGRADVPPSRRRIRRASIAIMAAGLPAAVCGLSARGGGPVFVASWSLVLAVVLAALLTAIADLLNTGRLAADRRRREAIDAAVMEASMRKSGAP